MNALFQFYLIIYGGLALGWSLSRWQFLAPTLMRFAILILEAPIFLYSFWILDISQIRQYAPIPVISTLLVFASLGLSRVWAHRIFSQTKAQGSFILAASFSNTGTTGGAFICYLLFGIQGLSLSSLYLLPYPLLIFTVGYSLAKRYASAEKLTWNDYLLNIIMNMTSLIPLLAITGGLLLNIFHVPLFYGAPRWADAMIKLDLAIMFVAVGMTLNWRTVLNPWSAILAIQVFKYVLSPLLALGCIALAYGQLHSLPPKIILIQSAMPPAIYAVITTNLYNLDRKLANALWASSTLLLIPVAALFLILFK
jgi:malate permease and related proteins